MSPPSRRGRAPPGSTPGGPSGMMKSSIPISAMSISGRGSYDLVRQDGLRIVRRGIGDGDSLDCLARLRKRLLRQRLRLLEAQLLDCKHRALGGGRPSRGARGQTTAERQRAPRGGPRPRKPPIACRGAHAPRRPRDPGRTRGECGSPCRAPRGCGAMWDSFRTLGNSHRGGAAPPASTSTNGSTARFLPPPKLTRPKARGPKAPGPNTRHH